MKKIATVVTMISVFSQIAFAEVRDPLNLHRDRMDVGGASEYMFRNDLEETLIPVYLIGAVGRPGLYHIPPRTDLVSLLALSGGPTQGAELDKVMIKRNQNNQYHVSEVNILKVMGSPDLKSPSLASNDVILVKVKEPAISSDTVATIGIITGILSIVVTGFLIRQSVTK